MKEPTSAEKELLEAVIGFLAQFPPDEMADGWLESGCLSCYETAFYELAQRGFMELNGARYGRWTEAGLCFHAEVFGYRPGSSRAKNSLSHLTDWAQQQPK